MRVAIDARALRSGRGVARWVRGLLGALERAHPEDEWIAVERRSRVIYGAAALAGRPTIAALAGGADVVWIPAPAPVAPGAPYVLSVHDRSWERRPQDFTRYERAWHAIARPRRLAARAAAVTAVSHAVADELADSWGVRAQVVSPGVEPAQPVDPRPGHFLLWVGAREPRKAPEVMRAAYEQARARGLDAELVEVTGGAGDEELAALYAGAIAVVTPSWLEGFGLPALEAAAHGTPAVVSDLPCFAETLGDAALRVPPGDADRLAAALLEIAGDRQLRDRLGAEARERAARYTWDAAAAALYPLLAGAAA
jgi:glycosyltransferase involved in cell wall biosynthesis